MSSCLRMPPAPGTSSCLAILVSSVTLMSFSVPSSTTGASTVAVAEAFGSVAVAAAAADLGSAATFSVTPRSWRVLLSFSTIHPFLRRSLSIPATRPFQTLFQVPSGSWRARCAPACRSSSRRCGSGCPSGSTMRPPRCRIRAPDGANRPGATRSRNHGPAAGDCRRLLPRRSLYRAAGRASPK